MTPTPASSHVWKFVRTGGLDQVALESGEDLKHLGELDQKLWVALSCPVKGLELDEKTLALIDTDGDGRIRAPELIAAVEWAVARLTDPGRLLAGAEDLPLAAINTATPEGAVLHASARQIAQNLGLKDADRLSVAQAADTTKILTASALNGDGVIPPEATETPEVQALIRDMVECMGGKPDLNGAVGVTAEIIEKFFTELGGYAAWVEQSAAKDIAVLGEATDAAVAALRAVRAKVEDYFGRCRLAAFDARATEALNGAAGAFEAVAAKELKITADEVAGFPLARVEAGRALPLRDGVNPAWAAALGTLQRTVVVPVLGAGKTALTEAEWLELNGRFAAYETWLGGKTGGTVEKLGLSRIKEILAGGGRAALAALVAEDQKLAPQFKAITDVERLVRYHRDLRTLLNNFVSFADFYAPDRLAAFQAGTLYLDSRSTELCIRTDGPSPLAAMSKVYIAYCACTRPGGEKMTLAACFTQGDSDYLFVGRHGVFYDRRGRDWDATITSIVDNPISTRQAFFAPYKKLVRMIEEQVAKRAAAAEAASSGRLAAAAETAANVDKTPPAAPKKVDVGTVAAIGVAITGAISALTLILGYIFQLKAWQYPLVLIGLVVVISGPSMLIAWLKLRQRTVGPILEGNGWAVNGRVRINLPLGTAMTDLATKPPGAKISLDDPFEDKAATRVRQWFVVLVVLGVAAAALWIRYERLKTGHYFWQPPPAAGG
ncbi:MAG TPA: hypothetical protein VHE13_10665 [Opitutus sp.]|nr:hypothetical protein [Opitutus sp.]